MKRIALSFLTLLLTVSMSFGQTTIKLEDFSSTSGWTLSHTFDDGGNDFCKRDQNFGGLSGYAMEDGTNYFIGAEDTNAEAASPSDGIVTLDLDQINISGYSSLTLSLDVSANTSNRYDQRTQGNGDYLDVKVSIDGGAYTLVGSFCSPSGSNGRLYDDADLNGIGGDDTGLILDKTIQNFSYSIAGTGSTLDVRLVFRFESGNEEIAFDNIKVEGSSAGGNNPPVITNVQQTPSADITSSTTVSVSADVTDSDGTVAGVELHWGTASGSLTNTINMSLSSGSTYTTDTDIPAQADGTTVYYEVYALDDDADDATSAEYHYNVTDPATTALPYSESFDTDLGDCYTYSVSGGSKVWHYASYGSNGYADMNGYNSGETEEDWLVLPGIDFDSYSNEIMNFDTWYKYGSDDANNYLKLYYSANYPGLGDPSSYTWTELTFTTGAADTWTNSGDIDLSAISGSSVYLAFKYHYTSGNYRHWEVDNISIAPSVPVNVTFQVDMSNETVSGDGVHVAGSFNGWSTTATEMLDPDSDGIYTVTLSLMSNTEYEFKYLNGNAWGTEENVPSGCQKPGTTNRYEQVTSPDYSIPVVCFSSCTACGGAYYDITFQVNMQNETVSGDGVYLAGTFTNWQNNAIAMTQNGDYWSTTVSLQEGSNEEYKFVNGDPNNGGSWESINNRTLTIPSQDSVLTRVCFNSLSPCPVANFVMINEVDADQSGSDTQEFVELYDGGVGNTSLNGLVLVRFNGSDDKSYDNAVDLDGYYTDANGYFVIGASAVPNVDLVVSNNFLQNGADAVALYEGDGVDFPNDTPVTVTNLLDALVYDTNDFDDAGLLVLLNTGEPQINEGGRGSSATHSNQRLPNGSGGQRNTNTYDQAIPTPGVVNAPSFTDWTGSVDTDWFTAGNWSNGVPTATINAVIPEVTSATYPVLNASGAAVLDLVVQNNAQFTIAPGGQLTVNDQLSNSAGAAGIILQSNATGQGSLLTNDATYMTVQTYLPQDSWHGVAPMVANDTAGVFLGVYLSQYNEADSSWTYIVPENTPLPIGSGYFAWSAGANYTANHVGVIQVADVSPGISFTTPHPHPGGQGWNIIGNPFTSAVEWNSNWTLTNVDATMYMYDNGNYKSKNINGTGTLSSPDIPVGQAVWIRTNAANPSITIPASERKHSTVGFYKNEVEQIVFRVEGNKFSDEMLIQFNDDASQQFDNQYDAYKIMGDPAAPQLYMVQDELKLTANVLPFEDGLSIPANLEVGNNGLYTISMNNTQYPDDVYLEDLNTGEWINLSKGDYTFFASTEDDAARFVIHFASPTSVIEQSSNHINIYANQHSIFVLSNEDQDAEVSVYDALGQELLHQPITDRNTIINLDSRQLSYVIVKVVSNTGVVAKKLFIK